MASCNPRRDTSGAIMQILRDMTEFAICNRSSCLRWGFAWKKGDRSYSIQVHRWEKLSGKWELMRVCVSSITFKTSSVKYFLMNASEKLHDVGCTVPTTMLVAYNSISFVPGIYGTCAIQLRTCCIVAIHLAPRYNRKGCIPLSLWMLDGWIYATRCD
jgi:hypothetical protein